MGPGKPALDRLVAEAQSGGAADMTALFERFQPLVRRVLRRYRHLPFAEDLSGEAYLTFVRLVERYDLGRGIAFAHYIERMLPSALHTFVRRECRRAAREVPSPAGAEPEPGARPVESNHFRNPDEMEWLLYGEMLKALLEDLPRRQAAVFIRRAIHGQEYAEIAAALGSSVGAVRVLYHEARKRLRRRWQELSCPEG